MTFNATKKDVIEINKIFDSGTLVNEESLDFAIEYAKDSEDWVKGVALVFRAILLDHVFEEGNKRTAALFLKSYAKLKGFETYNDVILRSVKDILLKNITDINKIKEMIKNCLK